MLVQTDGGVQSLGIAGTFSVVDVGLFVDGTIASAAGQRRLLIDNSATLAQRIVNSSMSRTFSLVSFVM